MNEQLKQVRHQVQAVAGQTATLTQAALLKGADLLAGVAAPTRQVVATAFEANAYAVDKARLLVDAELDTLAVVTELGAKRLKAAATAEDLEALVQGQVALLPETKLALLGEARKYLEMYFAAKTKVDAAIERRVMAWVTPSQKPARKAAAAKAPVAA